MVTVNSGACEPTDKFENTPRDKWHLLLITKRSFLDRRLKHDCRCLIEFCEEAESVFAELGYKSAEDMIREGYELDPTQIELAVAWLKHNEPQDAIGLKSVSDAVKLAKANKDSVQGRRNDLTSDKLAEVNRSGTSNANVLRRLARDHEDILAMVESGELSVHAAAIRAGIRKKPAPLNQLVKWWKKATAEERKEFLKLMEQL